MNENQPHQPSPHELAPEQPPRARLRPRRRVLMLLAFLLLVFILLVLLHEGFTAFLQLLVMLLIKLVIRVLNIAFGF